MRNLTEIKEKIEDEFDFTNSREPYMQGVRVENDSVVLDSGGFAHISIEDNVIVFEGESYVGNHTEKKFSSMEELVRWMKTNAGYPTE